MTISLPSPLFSICIPQFNRTSFLLQSLARLREQTFTDFEICVSDGGSTDGRAKEIVDFLMQSDLRHKYQLQPNQARYDQNLRASIALAEGNYCFLLGNDDMLVASDTLQRLSDLISAHDFPEVIVTNYQELSTGRGFRRVKKTAVIGKGVETAIDNFRNYSFVSGVLLDRKLAQQYATAKADGSEMYQTFLATSILAAGGRLLGVADTVILKDIQIEGESVDSYAKRTRVTNPAIKERSLPLSQLGRVVLDALAPCVSSTEVDRAARRVFRQLLLFTYPPWLIEYRKIQSWRYAVGIALGMRPRNLLQGVNVNWLTKVYVFDLYALVTLAGLLFPIGLFERLKPRLHALAKRW